MNKKILALSMVITIAATFVIIPSFNVQARVSSESRVLATILSLTEQAKSKINDNIIPTVDTVQDDLQFKQKFWQFEPFTVPPTSEGDPVVGAGVVGLCVGAPFDDDPSACAFNVESIQIRGSGKVNAIFTDGVITDISNDTITASTNLLVDSGIGKIGASDFVAVVCDVNDPCLGPFEFNGEKPQGMILFPAKVVFPVEASGSSNNVLHLVCLDTHGQDTECPRGVP